MKISKLFHWLYAILMLLPVFFIGVRCAYVVFNKNAKDSYSDKYIESAQVITATNQLVTNTEYTLKVNFTTTGNNIASYRYYYSNINVDWVDFGAQDRDYYSFKIFRLGNNNNYYVWVYYDSTNHQQLTISNANMPILTFVYTQIDTSNSEAGIGGTLSTYIYKVSTLDNAFIYSVNQLNDVPLFSWAKDSFLVEPFSYITGLFGVESTSPINTMLSYWLSVSIIWLVFDLVMYVPLLVHRWLDKGVLE